MGTLNNMTASQYRQVDLTWLSKTAVKGKSDIQYTLHITEYTAVRCKENQGQCSTRNNDQLGQNSLQKSRSKGILRKTNNKPPRRVKHIKWARSLH